MDNIEYIILGIVVFAFAATCLFLWLQKRKKLAAIVSTPTSPISSILSSPRSYGRVVEVKANIVAEPENLLSAPYTNRDCVFYHSIEKEKVREVYRDSRGRRSRKILYCVNSEVKSTEMFTVKDHTGQIEIDPHGCEIEGQTVLNKIEPVGMHDGGGWLGEMFEPYGRKIVAIIKEEYILTPSRRVYIIGQLFWGSKGPFIGASPEKNVAALISVRSEEALVAELKKKMFLDMAGCIAFIILGLLIILMGYK